MPNYMPVPLVHAVKVSHVLKDDEKIFSGPSTRQLDQVRKVAPGRRGFVLDAQRAKKVGQIAEARGSARKQENVRCGSARCVVSAVIFVAAAARSPHFKVIWMVAELV